MHIILFFTPVINVVIFLGIIFESFDDGFIIDKEGNIYKAYKTISNRLNKINIIVKINNKRKRAKESIKNKMKPIKKWFIEDKVEW